MEMVNGALAKALRAEINRQDLPIKQAAAMIRRSEVVVFRILRGEKVSERTLTQVRAAFPLIFEQPLTV